MHDRPQAHLTMSGLSDFNTSYLSLIRRLQFQVTTFITVISKKLLTINYVKLLHIISIYYNECKNYVALTISLILQQKSRFDQL